jgi:hypothetical protein
MRLFARFRPPHAIAASLAIAAACTAPGPTSNRTPPRIAWFDGAPRGHSHNDYLRPAPLQLALRHGFHSVEADVFLRDGELLVGHDEWMLQPGRTLERLYLDPLRERVAANGGSVHGDGKPFLLLVDIKRDGEAVYARLETALAERSQMLTRFGPDGIEPGAVTVILSGDRPRATLARQAVRLVAIDGRIEDLDGTTPPSLVPLISDSWKRRFEWDGIDPLEDHEAQRLRELAHRARSQGRMLRFWGAPDRPAVWDALQTTGVTWINTDRPRDFAAWQQQSSTR